VGGGFVGAVRRESRESKAINREDAKNAKEKKKAKNRGQRTENGLKDRSAFLFREFRVFRGSLSLSFFFAFFASSRLIAFDFA
jgi:hypothetical protein